MSDPSPTPDLRPTSGFGRKLLRRLALLAYVPLTVAVLILGVLHIKEQNRLNALEQTLLAQQSSANQAEFVQIAAKRGQQGSQRIIILLVASLLLVVVASYIAAWRALMPMRSLSEAIDKLGRGETVTVPVRSGTVLAHLQHSINQAARQLENAQLGMESNLWQASRELAEHNKRLEQVGRERARFLAAVSHDLRQPLHTLTLFASSLRAGETDPLRLKRIDYIEESVQSLDNLFSELLELSRLESGSLRPLIRNFPLEDVFAEVSRNFRMPAESHDLRLIVRKTEAHVHADSTMLMRILNNLVSNALRYTHEGGVLVGVRRASPDKVRIDVWDTGIGIAQHEQVRVFEECYQADINDAPSAGRRHGFGLGLATVRKLADLINCEVKLASRPGRGTLVSLTLPAGQAPATTPNMPAIMAPLDVSGLRILLIDDESNILEGLSALFGEWGCDIRTAEDEMAALASLVDWSSPPDVVISDFHLREHRNGLQAMDAIARHYGADPDAPPFARILVTGETRHDQIHQATLSRIPTLFKPVAPARLRETMLACLMAGTRDKH